MGSLGLLPRLPSFLLHAHRRKSFGRKARNIVVKEWIGINSSIR